ncbi:MAG: hypothetical protein ACRD8U_03975, partial [Pyrinomonadaceae bacterium]
IVPPLPEPATVVEIPADWNSALRQDVNAAKGEQLRVRDEFMQAFSAGLVCASFDRAPARPRYLFYDSQLL